MTVTPPMLPALQQLNAEASLFEALSAFQAHAANLRPVQPRLIEVLAAAAPAFEAGFGYTASHWRGELTVTLHHQGAKIGSSAPADVTNYGELSARLLAGLLGIPLLEAGQAAEPEPRAACSAVCPHPLQQDTPASADPEEVPSPAAVTEAEPEPQPEPAPEPAAAPASDLHRLLSDDERDGLVQMIKAMPTDRRKAFTRTFREVFAVPSNAKQITPFITEVQHMHFIDRYTVEAAGNVAA